MSCDANTPGARAFTRIGISLPAKLVARTSVSLSKADFVMWYATYMRSAQVGRDGIALTEDKGLVLFVLVAMLLTLMTLDMPPWRERAPLIRRGWKARTTKNGAMVLSAKRSVQACTVSGSKGSVAASFFAVKSGS